MIKSKSIFNSLWSANPITRRFILILLDFLIITFAHLFFVILINSNNDPNLLIKESFLWIYICSIIFSLPIYIFTKQYKTLSRYSEVVTFYQIFVRNIFLYFLILIIGNIFNFNLPNLYLFLLLFFIVGSCQIFLRLTIRDFVNFSNKLSNKEKLRVAIYGAGENGAQLVKNLRGLSTYKVICFFDDNPKLWRRTISGVLIRSPKEIDFIKKEIDQILIAMPCLKGKKRKNKIEQLKNYRVPLLSIPSVEQLVSGQATIDSLKPVSINDLLGRDIVDADENLLGPKVKGKVILITGAGGSIGSELCRQIYNLDPKKLILFDMNESSLYLINNYLLGLPNKFKIINFLGSACNLKLLKKIFVENNVDVVFHAAAYKHVPLVENNPIEGISNNIISTLNVCKAAESSNVRNIVFISSDKAVRPTNVMGASKRLSELIIQSFSQKNQKNYLPDGSLKHIFSMVRFGNVLDSSGSVVPLFKKQIEEGGPITLTHEKIIRYFMTIPEASQLVIQSVALAKGGDLFLLDMGEPVLIKQLAEQMIALSGQTLKSKANPDGDIEVIITGLRPGEKLYEELLINDESLPTAHPLIFKANEKFIDHNNLLQKVDLLIFSLINQDEKNTFKLLHELIPEWQNSK